MNDDEISKLATGRCVPADNNYQRLTPARSRELLQQLSPAWAIVDQVDDPEASNCLRCVYYCRDYSRAAELTQQIAALADREDHHPRLMLEWRKVTVEISTHAVNGLAEGDFVFAAKTELIARQPGVTHEPG